MLNVGRISLLCYFRTYPTEAITTINHVDEEPDKTCCYEEDSDEVIEKKSNKQSNVEVNIDNVVDTARSLICKHDEGEALSEQVIHRILEMEGNPYLKVPGKSYRKRERGITLYENGVEKEDGDDNESIYHHRTTCCVKTRQLIKLRTHGRNIMRLNKASYLKEMQKVIKKNKEIPKGNGESIRVSLKEIIE